MSLTFAQAAQATPNLSTTANGMVTLDHSGDPSTTLFFAIGASRGKDITGAFARAYMAEPDVAMKILFWARDARGGAGEREIFRQIVRNLEVNHPESLVRNLALIPEYGRWDDGFVFETPRFKIAYAHLITRTLRSGLESKKLLEQLPSMSEEDAQKILDRIP